MADEEDSDDDEDGQQLDSDGVRDQRNRGEDDDDDEEAKRAAADEVAVELSKLFGDSTRRRQVIGGLRIWKSSPICFILSFGKKFDYFFLRLTESSTEIFEDFAE